MNDEPIQQKVAAEATEMVSFQMPVRYLPVLELGDKLLRAFGEVGTSRELALAKTKLEEALHWFGSHISKNG